MTDDYEISGLKNDWASAFVYTEDQAKEAYEDMRNHFPFFAMGRTSGEDDPNIHQWYIFGSKEPLTIKRLELDQPETTAGLLEQAIAYLYDKHQLILYRINQPHGDGGLSPDEVGWMFAEKGLANPSVQGLTIEDAAIATFERIRTENRERQIKTQRQLEDTVGIAAWCDHHLDVLAPPRTEVVPEDHDDDD